MNLEEQGNSIALTISQNLSDAGYQVQRPNPDSLRWIVSRNGNDCGGFALLGDWVFVYGLADAAPDDISLVQMTVQGAIGQLREVGR